MPNDNDWRSSVLDIWAFNEQLSLKIGDLRLDIGPAFTSHWRLACLLACDVICHMSMSLYTSCFYSLIPTPPALQITPLTSRPGTEARQKKNVRWALRLASWVEYVHKRTCIRLPVRSSSSSQPRPLPCPWPRPSWNAESVYPMSQPPA